MRGFVVILAVVLVFQGCQKQAVDPITEADSELIAIGIQTFNEHIRDWKERVDSGRWEAMIEDGSYTDLMPADKIGVIDPKDYPAARIKEFEDAIAKMKDELARRSD